MYIKISTSQTGSITSYITPQTLCLGRKVGQTQESARHRAYISKGPLECTAKKQQQNQPGVIIYALKNTAAWWNTGNDILDIADHQYHEIQCLFKSQLMNQVAQQAGAYLSYLGWDTNSGGTVRVKSVFFL